MKKAKLKQELKAALWRCDLLERRANMYAKMLKDYGGIDVNTCITASVSDSTAAMKPFGDGIEQ